MYWRQQQVSFQWRAVTFGERAPNTNRFWRRVNNPPSVRIRQKHGRRSYLSVGVDGDTHTLLELEPFRSKDRGLLSYNIDMSMPIYNIRALSRVHTDHFTRRAYRSRTVRGGLPVYTLRPLRRVRPVH